MPHKHKRKADGDDSHYNLPPDSSATPLPVGKQRAKATAANPRNKKRKVANIAGYGKDDTPKAFTRLLALKTKGKPRSGLDDGPQTKSKRRAAAAAKSTSTTTAKPTTTTTTTTTDAPQEDTEDVTTNAPSTSTSTQAATLKILPGERLSEFNQRVNQALPLTGLSRSNRKIGGGVSDHRITKHEKKLKRLQAGWRKEEARIRDKELEERELAEEEEDEHAAMWEDKTAALDSDGTAATAPGRKNNKKKGKKAAKKAKRKLVVGEVSDKLAEEEDGWDTLQRRKQGEKKGLHDVVAAPPKFDRVPREVFKVKGGARVNVGNVPNHVGSLRKREEMGIERERVIEGYRKLVEGRRGGGEVTSRVVE